jgi:hypothetical protein
MRKFILIAGFVLASATAQAGDNRSLSLDPLAPPATARTSDPSQSAEAPQPAETPKAETPQESPKEAPKYVERPALVDRKADSADTDYRRPAVSRTASAPRAEKPRRQRYWTEGRIINELHRHGIYW